ncbi:mechanosensitive ion channel [Flammeovirga yaeyamensis]|uniref:Mechanosensitive ion channel n=1 Tax=Flammeovirga yaeyamensis TaxID=367791 RepID=A0AAX1N9T7_9BACT|nr:mechanosensitive ion channel family protein [Flammeovirga yaeyamensis]MBB3700435.1 MscS family membrane protein [Flammeovirga yaeyamensis]NMF36941.1 mechanosensitive ion channel family protein [Flammeovirga yaeyamensis]QWG02513.1 mechanosensitive ion channel [Flammeovirga yaeyamensis]
MKYYLSFLSLLSFLIVFPIYGQETEEEVIMESFPNDHDFYKFYIYDSTEYSQSTPYHALHTHMDFLDEENYRPAVAARVFPTKMGSLEERINMAYELKLIYAAKGIYLSAKELPLEKDYVEKNTNKKRFIIDSRIPEIYLIKVGERWRYSSYSCLKIRDLFEKSYPPYSRKFIKYVSKLNKGQEIYFGLKVWQWMAFLALGVIMYLAYFISQWVVAIIIKLLFSKQASPSVIHLIIKKFSKPSTLAFLAFIMYLCLPMLLLDSQVMRVISLVIRFFFGICSAVFVFRTADIIVIQLMHSKQRLSLDQHLEPVLRSSLRLVALMIGILLLMKVMGYNITNLITGISFGGLILAFAAQDTVKNFIGSIMLFTDQPFKVGDNVVVKGQAGIVEEIGFRTTKIRTFDNSLVSLPNNLAADNDINNLGKREFRRFKTMLTLEYGTPPENIKRFIEGIKECIENHELTRKEGYQVRLFQFSSSSIDVYLNVFFITDDYNIELQSREEMMFSIMEIAQRAEVNFAFPTQTIHLNKSGEE